MSLINSIYARNYEVEMNWLVKQKKFKKAVDVTKMEMLRLVMLKHIEKLVGNVFAAKVADIILANTN